MPIAEDDRKRIVEAVRAYIARERISREEFAQRAKLGKSTVDKLVVGIFSEKTILQIESQLKTSLRKGESGGERAGEEFPETREAASELIERLRIENGHPAPRLEDVPYRPHGPRRGASRAAKALVDEMS